MSTRLSRYVRLLLCSLMLLAPGCQVTDPNGGIWKLGPPQKGQPAQGKEIGTFVGPDGRNYILIDFNDDGVPDIAYDPSTGQMRPIKPIGVHPLPVPKKQPKLGPPPGDAKKPRSENRGNSSNNQPTQDDEDWSSRIDWTMGVDPAKPIEFQDTAEVYIAQFGLNVPPGTEIETSALRLNLFDTASRYTDATFCWSSDFRWRGNKSYEPNPQLRYEFYGLPGTTEEDPWFLSLRVAGPLKDVAKWAINLDSNRHWTYEFEWEGSQWLIEADGPNNLLVLYQDGNEISREPLN